MQGSNPIGLRKYPCVDTRKTIFGIFRNRRWYNHEANSAYGNSAYGKIWTKIKQFTREEKIEQNDKER